VLIGTCLLLAIAITAALISTLNRQTSPRSHGGDYSASLPTRSPNLTTEVLSLRQTYHLPALAIARGSPSSFAASAVGVRKHGSPIPALPSDIYHLGSLTKAMTATLLALLIQSPSTSLSWNSTLPSLLSGFHISPSHHATTLQDLTSHRSGITNPVINNTTLLGLYALPAESGRWLLANETLARPPTHPRGTFTYANANYLLAGLVLDLYSPSHSAEHYFQTHLLSPLHMTTAGFGPTPERSNTSIDNPWPHTPGPSGPIPLTGLPNAEKDNPPAYNTAGRMHMAPRDYNKFLQLHLEGMLGGKHNVLGLEAAQFAHLHTAYPTANTSDPGYGYTYGGWLRRDFTVGTERRRNVKAEYVLAHDGSNTLNFAYALLDSYAGEAYVALTNVGGVEADVAVQAGIVGMRNGTLVF
jgi:D-alanyl-D-alanine carboxypeptidase